MKKIVFIMCSFVLLISSCSENTSENVNDANFSQTEALKSKIPILDIDKNNFDNFNINRKNEITKGDPFKFESVAREGDDLEITISYSGGCQLHYLNVVWDGIVYTDDPCHINLMVSHDGNKDDCEAYITKTFSLNLKDLLGDVEYKDNCEYRFYSTFNSSDVPDLKIN